MNSWIYVTESEAVEAGYTNEGMLFGVPAWLRDGEDGEFFATTKIPLLNYWCYALDAILEIGSYCFPDAVIATPVHFGREIGK